MRSCQIIEILADVVKATASGCSLTLIDGSGEKYLIDCPEINYTFGNSQYVKDRLDELSLMPEGNQIKFPLIALFCPFKEARDSAEYYSRANVNILIACSTSKDYSNEQRLVYSFQNILRPIYERFLLALKDDGRIDVAYNGIIEHDYSENYSYGRYGAHTGTGDALSEPIDAINISNLVLTVKKPNCRLQ